MLTRYGIGFAVFFTVAMLPIETEAAPVRKKAAAVVPFQNNTGSKGLDFLASSISESVSTAVARTTHLRLVERAQLKSVLKEMELHQSGLTDDGEVKIQSAKIPAQFIIGGSFTGSPAEITVTIKAIDVSTATVAAMRRVTGPIDSIFTQIEAAMPGILAILSGENIAELTIVSEPQGATVFLDGNAIGETPLVAFKTTEGHHEIRIFKRDFKDSEQTFDLASGEKRKLDVYLVEASYRNRPYIDVAGYWFNPFKNFSKSAPLGAVGLGHAFRRFLIKFEFSAPAVTQYSYTYKVPYSTATDTRDYAFYMFHAGLNYHFLDNQYFAPYAGVQFGYTRIFESGINKSLYAVNMDKRLIHGFTAIAIAGMDFFPASPVVLFTEFRYYTSFLPLERNEVENISFLGATQMADRSFYLSAMAIGAGLRVRF